MDEPKASQQTESLEDTDEFLDLLGLHAKAEERERRNRIWLAGGLGLVYTLLCGWLAGLWLTLLLVGVPLLILGVMLWVRRSAKLSSAPRRVTVPLTLVGAAMCAGGVFLALQPDTLPTYANPEPNPPDLIPGATPSPTPTPTPPPSLDQPTPDEGSDGTSDETGQVPEGSDAQDPGGQNPGAQDPDGQNPGGQNPGGQNPGGQNPPPAEPAPRDPAPQDPGVPEQPAPPPEPAPQDPGAPQQPDPPAPVPTKQDGVNPPPDTDTPAPVEM